MKNAIIGIIIGVCIGITVVYVIWFYQTTNVVAQDHATLESVVTYINNGIAAQQKATTPAAK